MPSRLRLYDWRVSSYPNDLGICTGDGPSASAIANTAQRRLITCREATDEGWYGTWAEIAFIVSRVNPYFTAPREVARIESVDICERTIMLNNQFAEYIRFGNGRLPKQRGTCKWPLSQAYTRNSVPTTRDLTNTPQYIAVYPTDPIDVEAGRRVFLQGTDSSNSIIYSMDSGVRVQGVFLALDSPFAVSTLTLNGITGIQKDVTAGPVQFWQLDPTTGEQILLLTMQPGETVANYRRYYFDQLPRDCCSGLDPTASVTATAIVKLEPVEMVADTDYFTLQGEGTLEAIFEEAMCVRYLKMDSATAKGMAAQHHDNAVRILNGVLNHYVGKNSVAINFAPFGSARLRYRKVGMI